MSERWAVEMVEALRGSVKSGDNGGDGLMFAKIKTERPITLLAHDQEISKQLYINPALSPKVGDEVLVLKVGGAFYILLKVVPL